MPPARYYSGDWTDMANADSGLATLSEAPELPPREHFKPPSSPPRSAQGLSGQPVDTEQYEKPPQRSTPADHAQEATTTSPIPYMRDLQKVIGYLVPFPEPQLSESAPKEHDVPQRFMVYTPPHPPFLTKPEGESKTERWRKEGITHFCRRKWFEELREAKMRTPKNGKTTKFKRLKWRATKGTDWGIDKTKSSNLEFLNRIARMQDAANEIAEDVYRKTASPEEITLLFPPGLVMDVDGPGGEFLRDEFIASLGRTKKRATRDSIIAALLFPPAIVIDTLAVPVWPFGGLAEIDAVWFYASFRGAKTSRRITKRLEIPDTEISYTSVSKKDVKKRKNELRLDFTPSQGVDILQRYLAAKCHEHDGKLFPEYVPPPSETHILEAIGWTHSDDIGDGRPLDWEDKQWELKQMKDDLDRTFTKAAKEWAKWCKRWEKNPEKAVKK
ncbi:hypothetical protein HII31_02558 [Pseudocercospora fuligena]|uniref:Secreted protein n=1 Tax=Pseudocercospora fuligena TaxID=685502 RepID=A0A8H6RRV9_9PEZI|nr:hypothetical protein HII31_02558 [Pseudocercospora fuligena]